MRLQEIAPTIYSYSILAAFYEKNEKKCSTKSQLVVHLKKRKPHRGIAEKAILLRGLVVSGVNN
jgi:hypothetical protein